MGNEKFVIDNPYTQALKKIEELQRENDELHAKLVTTKTQLESNRSLIESRDKQIFYRDQTITDLKEKMDRYKEIILWLIDMIDLPEAN